jgi:methionine--tRNA ligase beta chain
MTPLKPEISYEDFQKLDIRVGTIVSAEKVEGSEKLIKLDVDFGELGKRQILTGMAKWHAPERFVGMQTTFILNFPAKKMMGLESQGMILALGLTDDSAPVFLIPATPTANGEGVR